jgi:tetratricopeptide (TPR) repeat protein
MGERGNYRTAKAIERSHVPATVQAVLAARIDRLAPEEKDLLHRASVIGKDVSFNLLHAIAEENEEKLHRSLAHLQASEFLYETRLFPDLEYTFKHALTHEVAYGSLLQERRRALHARIAEAIERLYAGRLGEHMDRLAHHALRGEAWDKAIIYLRQAGRRAGSRWAHREAVAYFEQALAVLKNRPQSREIVEAGIDIRLDLRPSLYLLGHPERTIQHVREAEALAETLGDQRRQVRVASDMLAYFDQVGDHLHSVESGERALSTARALADFALQVQISNRIGRAYLFLGHYRRAMDFWNWTMASLKGELLHERFGMANFQSVASRAHFSRCAAELGEFNEGIGPGEEAVRIAEQLNDPQSIAIAHEGIGHLYLMKGELARAISLLERSADICRDKQIAVQFARSTSRLGYAHLHSGRVREALALLEKAVEHCERIGQIYDQSLRLAWLGEGYLRAGRMDDAIDVAQRALDLSRRHNERGNEAWTLQLLGEIYFCREPADVENAENFYHQAVAIAEELGMRPLVAHCHLGLGELYRRSSNFRLAKEHLNSCVTLMREMEMGLWLERAEAELKKVG